MKRGGFTMIELIFVIVILGILAAVALPKFIGVTENAKAGKCKAFAGTMNRTIGPSIWSNAVLGGKDAAAAFTDANITAQVDFPADCGTVGQWSTGASAGTDFSVSIDGTQYDVNVTAASSSSAPIFGWSKH